MTYVTHQSEIKCNLECEQKRHYRYVVGIERKRRPKPLIRGTIIHRMVELKQHEKDPMSALKEAEKEYGKLFKEEREEYGDIIGDIRRLMSAYFQWYSHDPIQPLKIKKQLAVELEFEVENFAPGITLAGKIDRAGSSKDGRTWLEDTKSHNTLPTGDINYSDIQTVVYHWALEQQFKVKTDGIAWNYIRAKPPTIPDLLKSGELSRGKIDTTWDVYLGAIKANRLDPKDYEDMRTKLEGAEASFFVRSYLPVNPTLTKNILEAAREAAVRMVNTKKPVRNIGRHCAWCEFYGLCSAELRGLDVKFMMKADFREKPRAKVQAEIDAD